MAFFAPLTHKLLSQQVAQVGSTQKSYIVNTLTVHKDEVENIKTYFDNSFDVVSMNSALSNNLSDNFNYIGLVCSTIVFLFLWFSFGRIELAIIAFVPMVVSWIWILGLMSLLGIKFNIVNVILATFIFGQGDDYTIFMTEGCQYEYTHGKPVLASYKSSILQSALIMLVSIGTLIFAQHPAMRSLAEVTIVGMLSVVLMSFTLPPWLFSLLTQKDGKPRLHPITLKTLLKGVPKNDTELVIGRYLYKGTFLVNAVKQNLKKQLPALEALPVNGAATYAYTDTGYGECALLLALRHPSTQIVVTMPDDEKRNIAQMAAQGWVNNLEFKP
jgi:predicted exporter